MPNEEVSAEEYDSLTTPTKIETLDQNHPDKQKDHKKKNGDNIIQNQCKSKGKRKTNQKNDTGSKNQINESSIGKQVKLTQLWKMANNSVNTVSDSKDKRNFSDNDIAKKKIEEQMEIKNKLIEKLKSEKDAIYKKFTKMNSDKESYEKRAIQVIRDNLLEIAKMKRKQKSQIIPQYGYFKDGTFLQGCYLKEIREKIQMKLEQMKKVKQQMSYCKKKDNRDKQSYKFQQRFFQKELQQLNIEFKERQKNIIFYKDRLRAAQRQNNCVYARLNWPVVSDRFQTLELLGSGGFGEVYKCYDLKDNRYVALKENRFNGGVSNNQQRRLQFLKHVSRQVKIHQSLNHPNIAKMIQVINVSENQISFVLEYCSGPELSKYLKKHQCLQEKQAKQIVRQIIYALKYMSDQDNKIIHYDLKPSNIMFDNGVIKVFDFGLCKQMDTQDTRIDLTSQGTGTYWYLPPETFRDFDNQVSCKVDIWSVGVIFYELLYGKRPFGHGISQAKIFNEGIILKAIKVDFPDQTPLKYKVSEAAKKFIRECLKYDQNQRLSPVQAYNHDYFK